MCLFYGNYQKAKTASKTQFIRNYSIKIVSIVYFQISYKNKNDLKPLILLRNQYQISTIKQQKRARTLEKQAFPALFMEMRGIEPLSEIPATVLLRA